MDRIRQAIDRARRERESVETPQAPATEVAPPLVGLRAIATESRHEAPAAAANAETSRASLRARPFKTAPAALERRRILSAGGLGAAGDAFRFLRTQVLGRMRESGWQLLGVSSPRSGEGKTTVASNLAIAIAADPRHTALVVDLDVRRPSVAEAFGYAPDVGVDDVLRGVASVDAAMVWPDSFDGLRLLPARTASPPEASLLADGRCQSLTAELKGRYANRIIVVDMPAILESDEAFVLAPFLDCVLLVVTEGLTPREDVTRSLSLLARTPVIGTVLNRSTSVLHASAAH
jgi:Mrp family chromosome partitioning ATPase